MKKLETMGVLSAREREMSGDTGGAGAMGSTATMTKDQMNSLSEVADNIRKSMDIVNSIHKEIAARQGAAYGH
jgi:hypothetical protein